MAGHHRVDWSKAPAEAKAWAIDERGEARWLHWDAEPAHIQQGSWVRPGMSDIEHGSTPADTFGWDPEDDWQDSLTLRP
ncbi:hypothetical protein [Oleiagrimonas sp. C23AA]|uniref:hypothetical protein n=1 Tax=Oleiagrimonas sp. C23AA TaxID=2719047 RepID=UPI00197F52E2|nr:hypothetical protein [Oleiagrimonas sp. C23AA]